MENKTVKSLKTRAVLSSLLVSTFLSGCSGIDKGTFDASLPGRDDAISRDVSMWEQVEPITIRPTGAGVLVAKRETAGVPEEVRNRWIDVSFDGTATVGDFAALLGMEGIQMLFPQVAGLGGDTLKDLPMPISRYEGCLSGLLNMISTVADVAWDHRDGALVAAPLERWSIAVPQDKEFVETISKEIEALGAKEVKPSVRGSTIVYLASPKLNREVILPFFERDLKNSAMITLQVAVINVSFNRDVQSGIDWDNLNLNFGSGRAMAAGRALDAKSSPDTTTTDGTTTNTTEQTVAESLSSGELPDLLKTAGALGAVTGAGAAARNVVALGNGALGITGAINWLSKLGAARTSQNVQQATLSGGEVSIRSGNSIPYVKSIGVSALGTTGSSSNSSANSIGTAETETAETGLDLKLAPLYDDASGVVTVDIDMSVKDVLEFRELSAGKQLGTLTQPVTQEREMKSKVQIQAGETVVIGGIRIDKDSSARSAPSLLLDVAPKDRRTIEDSAMFVVIRPIVVKYKPLDTLQSHAHYAADMSCSADSGHAAFGKTGVTGKISQVFAGPGKAYKIIGNLQKNQPVTIIGVNREFTQIKHGGVFGFIESSDIKDRK